MKLYPWITVALLFPLITKAQTSVEVKKITDNKLCDTCVVASIFDLEEPISFIIAGAGEEGEYRTRGIKKTNNGAFPYILEYAVTAGSFSLDFIPYLPLDLWDDGQAVKKEYTKNHKSAIKKLQFSVVHNHQLAKDWTGIYTLGPDKEFQPGSVSNKEDQPGFTAWENYCAGKFQMNVYDSLFVHIRNAESKKIIYSVLVKRVHFIPQFFSYNKFSSGVALQDIMNGKFSNTPSGYTLHGDSIENYEMEPDEITVFRFSDDPRVRTNEVEYSFSSKPDEWQTIHTTDQQGALPSNFSIVIYKPAPGETQEVRLRYKQQPESMYHIKIHVKKRPVSNTWLKILAALGLAALLFSIWYVFKRRSYLKKIRQVTLAKDEIESKLQLLSGQLNPHFLYNSLNSIQGLINKNDTENASLYVSEVSSFLRTIMSAGKKEYVSLQEELNIEEAYIKLEQKRKIFAYHVINNCGSDLSQIEFPPSLLQPVIENSIHHGFSRNITGPLITVGIDCKERQLIISVADNGQGFNTALMKTGQGLTIVQKRIALMNEKHSGMPVEMKVASNDSGTVTTFTFQNWL